MSAQPFFGLDEHLQRCVLDVDQRAAVEDDESRLIRRDQLRHSVADPLRVQKERAAFDAQNQQSWPRLIVRMVGRSHTEYIGATLAADDMHRRIVGLMSERE